MQIGRARLFYRSVIAGKGGAKALALALALTGLAPAAQAEDPAPGGSKDVEPKTSVAGVTVYGAIDVGYAFQTHGAPISGSLATGLEYNMFGSANVHKEISTVAPSGLSQSFWGIKVEESIISGWTALAKVESGFQPTSGELSDGCASLARMNGVFLPNQIAKGDSSRCGQLFNGPAYLGVSNAAYGTLTVGRQNTLDLELQAVYDPMALSYAFSVIGYSGSAGGGIGDTEAARWDNSVKYIYQYGPAHAAVMYSVGSEDTAIQTGAIAGGAGFSWQGFAFDFVYTKENGAVGGSSLSLGQCESLGFKSVSITSPTLSTLLVSPACAATKLLNGTISDNAAWTVGAKYTFDFSGGGGMKDGGLKDSGCCCTGSPDDPWWCGKLTLYAGYQNVEMDNPTDPVRVGATTIGGYVLGTVNNVNFDTTKVLQTIWAGAKYELPSNWALIGAWYHVDQNNWITGTARRGCAEQTAVNRATAGFLGRTVAANCSGDFEMGAFVVDYTFNKYFDIYAGVNYSTVDGGLSSGFLVDNSFLFMTGGRLRF